MTVDELMAKLQTIKAKSPNKGRTSVCINLNGREIVTAHDCVFQVDEIPEENVTLVTAEISVPDDFRPKLVFLNNGEEFSEGWPIDVQTPSSDSEA